MAQSFVVRLDEIDPPAAPQRPSPSRSSFVVSLSDIDAPDTMRADAPSPYPGPPVSDARPGALSPARVAPARPTRIPSWLAPGRRHEETVPGRLGGGRAAFGKTDTLTDLAGQATGELPRTDYFVEVTAPDPAKARATTPPQAASSIATRARDLGVSALKGAIGVPEAAVGLADILSGGRAGKMLEQYVAFKPAEAKAILDTFYSEGQQAAFARVQNTEGLVSKAVAALSNPSVIAQSVMESAPSMLGGAGVARGLLRAAPKVGPLVAGAVGEGAVSAGASAEQVRQASPGGRLTSEQSALAAVSGVGTGALGVVGAKVAKALGIADVETLLAGANVAPAARKGLARQVVEGMAVEGALEELPQSVQEQVLQNIATGRDLLEGVDDAAVMGALAGAVMGGGAQVVSGLRPTTQEIIRDGVGGDAAEVAAGQIEDQIAHPPPGAPGAAPAAQTIVSPEEIDIEPPMVAAPLAEAVATPPGAFVVSPEEIDVEPPMVVDLAEIETPPVEAEAPVDDEPPAPLPAGSVDASPVVQRGEVAREDAFVLKWLADDLREMAFESGGTTLASRRRAADDESRRALDAETRDALQRNPRVAGTPVQETFQALGVTASRRQISDQIERYLAGTLRKPTKAVEAARRLAPIYRQAWDARHQRFDRARVADALQAMGLRSDRMQWPQVGPAAAGQPTDLMEQFGGTAPAEVKARLDEETADPANLDGRVADYEARTAFGNTISRDNAKELWPVYGDTPEGRTRYNDAVSDAAGRVADEVYRRRLEAEPGFPGMVVVTGGGPGSGKTTITALNPKADDADVIFDSQANDPVVAKRRIEQALASGRTVHRVYAYRDPVDAWTNGVLPRAMETGRPVSMEGHVRSHRDALQTAIALTEEYSGDDRVVTQVFDNTHEQFRELSPDEALAYLRGRLEAYNEADVAAALQQQTDFARESGLVSAELYDALGGAEGVRSAVQRGGDSRPEPREGPGREGSRPAEAPPALPVQPVQPAQDVAVGDEPRKFSSTQVNLPDEVAARVRALAQTIPAADLAEDGREAEPHITVQYGLETDDVEPLRQALAGQAPIVATLGKTSLFTNEDADVVKIDIESPDLRRVRAAIEAVVETPGDTHPDYVPHATVAYVRSGKGKKYAGDDTLEGQTVTIDRIVFSTRDRQTIEIPLTGKLQAIEATAKTPAESAPLPFTVENLAAVFGISEEVAQATFAMAEAMGLPIEKIQIVKGGEPGEGALPQWPVVADLRGDELGATPTAETAVPLARAWFREHLQGSTIERAELTTPIRFTSASLDKLRHGMKGDPRKAQLVPAIPALLREGAYLGRETLRKPRRDRLVAFHRFVGFVQIGAERLNVAAVVGEDDTGHLYYDLQLPDAPTAPGTPRESRGAGAADESQATTPPTKLADGSGELNILYQGGGLFDEDVIETGERQPRLPGDVGAVREEERPTPQEELPLGEFRLTAQEAKPRKAKQAGLLLDGKALFHAASITLLDDDTDVNASGESAASAEAIGRIREMKAKGEAFAVRTKGGSIRPLIGPDAVDYSPAPNQEFGIQRADGSFQVLSRGEQKLYQTAMAQGAKASVEFLEDGSALMRALKDPNASSGAHELAHIVRRWLLNREVAAEHRAGVTDEDIATTEQWAGATDGQWPREAEEKFARGFEHYLRDGGPTLPSKIKAVFAKFSTWLKDIYQTVTGSAIDVDISPAMRQVFDRLVTRAERLEAKGRPTTQPTAKRDDGRIAKSEPWEWFSATPDGPAQQFPTADAARQAAESAGRRVTKVVSARVSGGPPRWTVHVAKEMPKRAPSGDASVAPDVTQIPVKTGTVPSPGRSLLPLEAAPLVPVGAPPPVISAIAIPEMVALANAVAETPQVVKKFRGDARIGEMRPEGRGRIRLLASLFARTEPLPAAAPVGSRVLERVVKRGKTLSQATGNVYVVTGHTERGNPILQLVETVDGPVADGETLMAGDAELASGRFRLDVHERNLQQLAKTLAHEIGHLVDWLPDKTLARGNLLGRLKSLHGFLKHTYTGQGGETIHRDDIRRELITVSKAWRGDFVETGGESYDKYRQRGRELYADAISALFNNPGWLEETAPTFYREFFANLDTKPEVREAYFGLQELLSGTPEQLIERRLARDEAMLAAGDAKAADVERLRQAERVLTAKDYWLRLRIQHVDKNVPVIDRVKALEKRGITLNPDRDPRYFLEERNYLGAQQKAFLETNIQPIYEAMQEAEIPWHRFGQMLFYDRIIAGDRSEVANPNGMNVETAQELREALRETLTPEQRTVLDASAKAFRAALADVQAKAYAAGLYTPEMWEQMQANPAYVAFRVIEHMDEDVSARVAHQVGTLKWVQDPVDATVLKMLATIRATETQKMKVSVFGMLEQFYPAEITQATHQWNGKAIVPVEPDDPKKQRLIRYYEKGKLRGKYVDPYIADSIENLSIGQNFAIVAVLRWLNGRWFRPVFTSLNLAFQAFNTWRDFARFWKNVPTMTLRRAVLRYLQALPVAKARAFGISKDASARMQAAMRIVQEGEAAKVFSITFNDAIAMHGREIDEYAIEETFLKGGVRGYGTTPPTWRTAPHKALGEFIKNLGDFIETLPKAAAVFEFTGDGDVSRLTADQRSFIRRKVGSPDFLSGGTLKPLTNEIALFSNAITQAWRADLEVATDPTTRSGFWWKTAAVNILPKLMIAALLAAQFDDDDESAETEALRWLQSIYAGMTAYDLANYLPIPIGVDDQGNATYIRIPQDDSGRLIGGLVWKALQFATSDRETISTLATVMEYAAGQGPGLTPSLAVLGDTIALSSGRNPYDSFRNRFLFTRDEMADLDAWRKAKKFIGYEFQQIGGGIAWKFYPGEQRPRTQTTGQWLLEVPVLSNAFARFIRITNYGRVEKTREAQQGVERQEATARLDERQAVNEALRQYQQLAPPQQTERQQTRMAREIVRTLYPDMRPDDRAKKTRAVLRKIRMGAARGSADPTVDAIMGATSNAQKVAGILQAKREMAPPVFAAWYRRAERTGVVSEQLSKLVRDAQRAEAREP